MSKFLNFEVLIFISTHYNKSKYHAKTNGFIQTAKYLIFNDLKKSRLLYIVFIWLLRFIAENLTRCVKIIQFTVLK
ncbi:hypothetical protein HMPREF9554_03075 [Treponema phagedenis F0421]|nr:hypothetical protein HMPREF9554_03075 [Treponema phagedenis F0421]